MAVTPPVRRFLRRHELIAADTMVFIYHFEHHPRYARATQDLLESLEGGTHRGVTSVLSLAEVLVQPFRQNDLTAANLYRRVLTTFPNLRLLDVNRDIAERAARLRATHGLGLPDAVQMATAQTAGATGFVNNDPDFKRVPGIEVLLLDEAAPARR